MVRDPPLLHEELAIVEIEPAFLDIDKERMLAEVCHQQNTELSWDAAAIHGIILSKDTGYEGHSMLDGVEEAGNISDDPTAWTAEDNYLRVAPI